MADELFNVKFTALRRALIERDFSGLNEMQREAVLKTEGPLLVLAGAGSGKTTVLINRIVNILKYGKGYASETAPSYATEDDLDFLGRCYADESTMTEDDAVRLTELCSEDPPRPWEVLAITFTNKAAGEIRERLERAIGTDSADVWAHTFHSACMRILRRDIYRLGYDKSFTVYDEDDKKRVLTDIIRELNLDDKRYDVKAVAGEIGRAKDNLIDAAAYADSAGDDQWKKAIARIYDVYSERLKRSSALDFDDIIVKTVELLRDYPEVLSYYTSKFRYVLIDEYQDTNHAQYVLSKLLASSSGNICVVGDDDQGIYRFRGATIKNILEFEKTYKNAHVIRLEQNYRSTSNILNAANAVIANNCGRKGKTLWTDNGDGERIVFYEGETNDEEAFFIASTVLKEYSSGKPLSDFAVLYRNNVLSNTIENAFKRNGIPYRMISGLRFFDRAEVKDMLAYLWLILNPSDDLRLRRIINNPPRKIGARTLAAAEDIASKKGIPIFEVISHPENSPELSRASEALSKFTQIIEELRSASESLPLPEFYEAVMDKTGYAAMLAAKNDEESKKRLENVRELGSTVAEYVSRTPDASLSGLMEEISLFTDIDNYDSDAGAVAMLTIHAAKGLEFPEVIVCGMEEGVFPGFRSMESSDELEEERRLCYVAMTRAKKRLYLTSAERRMMYGQTRYAKPSRFIDEIPADCMKRIGLIERRSAMHAEAHVSVTPRTGTVPKRPVYAYKPSVTSSSPSVRAESRLKVGDIVEHKAFGKGLVTGATPMGGDTMLEVAFDRVGTKRLMENSASKFMKKLH